MVTIKVSEAIAAIYSNKDLPLFEQYEGNLSAMLRNFEQSLAGRGLKFSGLLVTVQEMP